MVSRMHGPHFCVCVIAHSIASIKLEVIAALTNVKKCSDGLVICSSLRVEEKAAYNRLIRLFF